MESIQTITSKPETLVAAKGICALWEKMGHPLTITHLAGDLSLELDTSLSEGLIEVANETVTIKASSEKYIFQVAMHLLQLIQADSLSETRYQVEFPREEKSLMMDIGRKYFSLESLKEAIDMLAFFQFDNIQLHFSENEGFRIECQQYPDIMSDEYLTKAEIRELIQYAAGRFMEIIPDFDAPGHLKHILQNRQEWCLPMIDDEGNLTKDLRALDILNPEAVAFVHSIYKEYGELFNTSRYFHIGADEFVPFDELERYPTLKEYASEKFGSDASGIEVFIEFVNQTIDFIHTLGFYPIVWNDGFYRVNRTEKIHLSADCIVSYWTRWDKNMAPIESYLEKGYTVINHNDNYFYYVLGEHASYTYPTYEKVMTDWHTDLFASQQEIDPTYAAQVKATALCIWSNIPEAKTEDEVNQDIFYILAAAKQKINGTDFPEEVFDKFYQKFFS
ncbi:family 20 glycosylhydrolase [Enterococcus massiliensis]|uniref:family 20 glycosylhydrolase n=1 Tax=Enterococcus massiliensis TaxID=1640685 RepID=UPI00065DE343|nr:family 20 glycosylhydrolase [Enterococcus massiliensis]